MKSKSIRFIKERRLLSLIGVEYALASETKTSTKGRLCATCCFIVTNALLALLSMYYAFDNLFESVFIGMLLAFFFAALLLNLYVFLIQTFSKNSLDYQRKKMGLQFSNFTRIVFVLFIGFIISCPLYVMVLNKSIASNIEEYKHELIDAYKNQNSLLHNEEIKRIDKEIAKYAEQAALGITGANAKLKSLKVDLKEEEANNKSENDYAADEINNSAFFLKEIQIGIIGYKVSWLLIFFIVLLYAAPVFLVQSISSKNEYFIKRIDFERKLIEFHYEKFKQHYSNIFEILGLTKSFYEAYTDAPFNTKKPEEPKQFSQEEFMKDMFGNSKKA
jgi:hypothetical protein